MSNVNIDPTTVATVSLIGQLQDMSVGIWGADGSTIDRPLSGRLRCPTGYWTGSSESGVKVIVLLSRRVVVAI